MKPTIYGIDFGTTYSKICFAQESINGKMIPEAITNEKNETHFPSILYYKNTGEILFGSEALRYKYDKSSIVNSKRLIGEYYDDLISTEITNNIPNLCKNDIDGTISYEIENLRQKITCFDAVTEIFKQLKKIIENRTPIDKRGGTILCYITIPVMYSTTKRKLIRDSAIKAGLCPESIISESNAAAIYFANRMCFDKPDAYRYLIVIDIGGGTTDVSIVKYRKNEFCLISVDGHPQLGGEDINRHLIRYIENNIPREKYDVRKTPNRYSVFRKKVEGFKLLLGNKEKTLFLDEDEENSIIINPKQYKIILNPFVEKLIPIIRQTLKQTHESIIFQTEKDQPCPDGFQLISYSEYDVFLTGGTSNIQIIQDSISELFSKDVHRFEPNHAIVYGASCLANSNEKMSIKEALPFSIVRGDAQNKVFPIIPKNSIIPCSSKFVLTIPKMQDSFSVPIYEGDIKLADFNKQIARITMNDLGMDSEKRIEFKVKVREDYSVRIIYNKFRGEKKRVNTEIILKSRATQDEKNNEIIEQANKKHIRIYQIWQLLSSYYDKFKSHFNPMERIQIEKILEHLKPFINQRDSFIGIVGFLKNIEKTIQEAERILECSGIEELLEKLENYQNSFIKKIYNINVDVIFCVDATGSMSSIINQAKNKCEEIARIVREKHTYASYRFGAIFYRDPIDSPDDENDYFPLSEDITKLKNWISTQEAYGGGDGPEDWVGCYRLLHNNVGIKTGNKVIIIHIADAPAHGKSWGGNCIHQDQDSLLDPLIGKCATDGYYFRGLSIKSYPMESFKKIESIYKQVNPMVPASFTEFSSSSNATEQFQDFVLQSIDLVSIK